LFLKTIEAAVCEIRRRTRRKLSPEEKVRIVLEGLRRSTKVASILEGRIALFQERSNAFGLLRS
jgi:hypothetical protein